MGVDLLSFSGPSFLNDVLFSRVSSSACTSDRAEMFSAEFDQIPKFRFLVDFS
jgi:hypothetical protein